MKTTTLGFMVIDSCEDWNFPLRLAFPKNGPKEGVLENFDEDGKPRVHVFLSRQAAREAIKRTYHWRSLFAPNDYGDASNREGTQWMQIVRVEGAAI